MAMSNLSIEGEFRYIIQWFNEWSELQRDDFVPVLVEYLLRETSGEVYMNGMVNSVSTVGINDKPMSLFQCRIKLFREWNKKWPLEFKHKLKEKIIEIDAKVGEKIINELKADDTGPELAVENSTNNGSNGVAVEVTTATDTVAMPERSADAEVLSAAVALVDATEEAINLDSRLAAVLSNETPVDDNDNENDDNSEQAIANVPVEPMEPAEPVLIQDRQLQQPQEENAAAVTVA